MDLLSIAQLRRKIYEIQNAPEPQQFNILFWTANVKTQTGGDGIELKDCLMMKNQLGRPKKELPNKPLSTEHRKNPNHDQNNTFDLIHVESGNKFKVHIDLVSSFNNKNVVPNIYE